MTTPQNTQLKSELSEIRHELKQALRKLKNGQVTPKKAKVIHNLCNARTRTVIAEINLITLNNAPNPDRN